MCYDEGTLQAFLDGEVTGSRKAEVEQHLRGCAGCRERFQELKENQDFTDARLAGYLRFLDRAGVDTGAAWKRFNNNRPAGQEQVFLRKGVFKLLLKYRVVAAAAVLALALAATFSFGSVRSAAGELLTIFRVEKVKTVSITPEDMSRIEKAVREGAGQVDIGDFGKLEFSGRQTTARISLEEARRAFDFKLKLPARLPEGYHAQEIYRHSGGTLDLTLDTVRANQVLKSLGSARLLPDELNGRTFSVKVPDVLNIVYRSDGGSITVWQGRSPELIAPGSDVGAIRDALLALPFLPESLRSQLAAVNDWQHTFLIPDFGGTSREVAVAGSQGVFITPPAGEKTRGRDLPGSLIWQKDGVVYAISGHLTLEQALDMANSMK